MTPCRKDISPLEKSMLPCGQKRAPGMRQNGAAAGRRLLLVQRNNELQQKEQECRQDAQKYAKKFGRVH